MTFIPTLFLTFLAARNYQFRFYLVFVTFHGPRSPQLENGTFERVNASVRDRRACPETKESGFTLLRQCFRNNVRSTCINFLLPWTRRVFRHYDRSFFYAQKILRIVWNKTFLNETVMEGIRIISNLQTIKNSRFQKCEKVDFEF